MAFVMLPAVCLPRRVFRHFVLAWSGVNGWFLRTIGGITVEVRGREHIPQAAAIVASKHQSEWETNVFLHLLDDPTYIMKIELARIPAYGQYARRMGMIFIDRGGHASTLRKLVRDSRRALADNRSIVIFPEGTRIDPGETLPYRPGVAALYAALGVPVVPVVHNSGMHWPARSFRKYPGTIVLEFLPPIPPGLSRRDFMARLEEAMEGESRRLLAEIGGVGRPEDDDAEDVTQALTDAHPERKSSDRTSARSS